MHCNHFHCCSSKLLPLHRRDLSRQHPKRRRYHRRHQSNPERHRYRNRKAIGIDRFGHRYHHLRHSDLRRNRQNPRLERHRYRGRKVIDRHGSLFRPGFQSEGG